VPPGAQAVYVRSTKTSGAPSLSRARNLRSKVLSFRMDAREWCGRAKNAAISPANFREHPSEHVRKVQYTPAA
jgi:hypothetical protein